MFIYKNILIYIYIIIFYTYIITECIAQLVKASDTQELGSGFKPLPDHQNRS